MFKNLNIVVGVTGGIAVFKAVSLVSELVKKGANVYVIMTKNAQEFVTPLTFKSISNNDVVVDMFESPDNWDNKHISLAQKADIMIIAPATFNIIGKVATGIADDFLTTTIAATKSKVVFVPAMNDNMYENKIFIRNTNILKKNSYYFIDPEIGRMACGTFGKGRYPKNEKIIQKLTEIISYNERFKGLNILITAGPTKEYIDPVRYISNRSSGKMGYSIANIANRCGANVKLISGPVNINAEVGIELVNVISANDMNSEVFKSYKNFDIIIMVAAVVDYKMENISNIKIKKENEKMTLNLIKNPDISMNLGSSKDKFLLVGFCAETNNLIENAKLKLKKKKFDMIVANDVTKEGAGFEGDTNVVTIIDCYDNLYNIEKSSKEYIAEKILNNAITLYDKLYRNPRK
ncbi:MAG: bifunctional phosphopantothenoylcysteine decarboxylase/phosphopantothenate--cysteine ligase CoaBC [Clostridiales bacterium]